MGKKQTRYDQLIESIFFEFYESGAERIEFKRSDLEAKADELEIDLPKNLGDVIYTYRFRSNLPEKIAKTEPAGYSWGIKKLADQTMPSVSLTLT